MTVTIGHDGSLELHAESGAESAWLRLIVPPRNGPIVATKWVLSNAYGPDTSSLKLTFDAPTPEDG